MWNGKKHTSVGWFRSFFQMWMRTRDNIVICMSFCFHKQINENWLLHFALALSLLSNGIVWICIIVSLFVRFFFKEKENKNSVILRYVTKCLSLVYLFKHLSSYLHWYTLYTHTRKKKTGGVLFCKYKESINLKKKKKWNNHQIWSKDIVQIY